MPTLSAAELDRLVVSVGITDPAARATAVAIALTESGGQTGATHRNSDRYRSIDYGLWQINGHWHPSYDTRQLLTASYNATAMAQISANGTNWGAWTTFQSGRYQDNLDKAKAAVAANLAGNIGAGGNAGAGENLAGGGSVGAGGLLGLGSAAGGLLGLGSAAGGLLTDAAGNLIDAAGNIVSGASSLLDPAAILGSAISKVFGNWQRDAMGLLLGGVFVIAALAIAAIGLSQLSGLDADKVMTKAQQGAQAAALAA